MDLFDAITHRRSIKAFSPRPILREEIERLLETVTLAPNHRMTQPWRFRVMGPETRRAYGAVLGARKAKKIEDPAAAQAVIDKVADAEAAVPVIIAVSMVLHENLEIREEDHAATMMGVEHLMLAATAMGLGTHLKTGAVMDDPRTREALGIPDGERIVAIVHLGEPLSQPDPRPRTGAEELTTWMA